MANIKKDFVNSIEQAEIEDAEGITLTYNIKSFFEDLQTLADILGAYQQKLVLNILRNKTIYYTNVNFAKESTSIEEFSKNISELIKPIDPHDTIQIKFSPDIDKIISVQLTREGYKTRKITKNLFSFTTESPQTRKRTLNFVASLSSIMEYFLQNKMGNYDDFVTRFFKPPANKKDTRSNLENYANGAQEPVGLAKFGEIVKRSTDVVLSEAMRGFSRSSCLSEEENQTIEQLVRSEQSLLEKQKFSKQLTIDIHDRFFAQAPEIFDKIASGNGEKALNELGSEFLNRLGVLWIVTGKQIYHVYQLSIV